MGVEVQDGFQRAQEKKTKKPSYRCILALLEMQGHLCALSGVRLDVDNAELDHKIPVARGGTNNLDNLQWVHKEINRAKGTMTNDEFIKVCEMVANSRLGLPPASKVL